MAEGTDTDKSTGFFPDNTGSEAVYDFFCEICKERGQNLEAVGFCVDCGDYLCERCFSHHKQTRFTFNHDLLDKESMPKDNPLSYDSYSRIIETKCNTHRGETVEYYCKTHDVLACGKCIIKSHRNCPDVEDIRELSEHIEQSQEYQMFVENMKQVSQRSLDIVQKSHENITKIECCCEQTVQGIKSLRKKINELLDELENSVITQAKTIKADAAKSMEIISDKAKGIAGEMEKITSQAKDLQTSRKICQLYITLKKSSNEIKRMISDLDETEMKSECRLFAFEPSSTLQNICKDIDAFGKIQFRQNVPMSRIAIKDDQNVAAVPTRMPDIDIKSNMAKSEYKISGISILSRNKVVIVDAGNFSVGLIDTPTSKVIHDLKVTSQPRDVCVISQTEAVVTLPYENKILFLTVSEVLAMEREICVSGISRGIAYSRGRLVVTYIDPPKLEVIDLQGNLITRIETGKDGQNLFHWPQYVCLSNDEDTIYISDNKANKIIHLNFNGEVKTEYTDRDLISPRRLCVDQQGNIYVACSASTTVQMLTADCLKVKNLLTEADGLEKKLQSISYCDETKRLFIGMWDKSKIIVFKLDNSAQLKV